MAFLALVIGFGELNSRAWDAFLFSVKTKNCAALSSLFQTMGKAKAAFLPLFFTYCGIFFPLNREEPGKRPVLKLVCLPCANGVSFNFPLV